MANKDRSLYEQGVDRIAAMTAAGQQKPAETDDDHDRFAVLSRAADEESGGGSWS